MFIPGDREWRVDRSNELPQGNSLKPIHHLVNELSSQIHIPKKDVSYPPLTVIGLSKWVEKICIAAIQTIFPPVQKPEMKVLQEYFRNHEIKKEINYIRKHPNPQLAVQTAEKLNDQIESEPGHPKIYPFVREPLENMKKKKNQELNDPLEKGANFISYERFRNALRNSFSQTLTTILSSQKNSYIVVDDEEGRSTNWTVSHILDIMSIHPPHAIIKRAEISNYLKKHPEIQHLVMMDDAAYSGRQVGSYIRDFGNELKNQQNSLSSTPNPLNLHICIPYLSKYARENIQKESNKVGLISSFSPSGTLLSFDEKVHLGYFSQKKMIRPDIKTLLAMPAPQPIDPEDLQSSTWCEDFEAVRKNIFSKNDVLQRHELGTLIEELRNISQKIQDGKKILNDLYSIKQGVQRWGTTPELIKKIKKECLIRAGFSGDVNFWHSLMAHYHMFSFLSHKKADRFSTIFDEYLLNALQPFDGQEEAIEPYKMSEEKNEKRKTQIERLQKKFPTIVSEWKECSNLPIDIVQSNRGIFLLGDNYQGEAVSKSSSITITSQGTTIPFGGSNGAFQFKIEEMIPFSINDRGNISQFIYENGRIRKI